MTPRQLDPAPLDALASEIEALPDQVDGIDLASDRSHALHVINTLRQTLARLRKLATPA